MITKDDVLAISDDVLIKLHEQEGLFYSADTHAAGKMVGWWQVTAYGDVDGLEEGKYWTPLFEKPIREVGQDNQIDAQPARRESE